MTSAGFSFLEVVITVSILAILAGVVLPVASSVINFNARRASSDEIRNLGHAVAEYFRATEEFPRGAGDLMVDPGVTGWAGPYILLDSLSQSSGTAGGELDPWGNAYTFQQSGSSVMRISSAGPDQSLGNEDDLSIDIDVSSIRLEVTRRELAQINRAILRYNASFLPNQSLPTTYSSLLSKLVSSGYLSSATPFETDGWGDSYRPNPLGSSPVVQVGSIHVATLLDESSSADDEAHDDEAHDDDDDDDEDD